MCEAAQCDVSIILPMYNAEAWLDQCLASVLEQDFDGSMEICIFDDCSTDDSLTVVAKWEPDFMHRGIKVTATRSDHDSPQGVGYARNQAIARSVGRYLCFLDADDVMMVDRISTQHSTALLNQNAIIGSQFYRLPLGSTKRYTKWGNGLTKSQLLTQVYMAHGPTVIMPTWFCSRKAFDAVGKFSESGKGTPEDLIFFYRHLRLGGAVLRVDRELLMYRYHRHATTFSVDKNSIWNIRMTEFQQRVLSRWKFFTIWNAGKQGRKFYRSLDDGNREKVLAFCDVDVNKISKGYTYEYSPDRVKPKIPVVHFADAKPPYVICVKQDLTGGIFEENLRSLCLTEGLDYYYFS